MSNWIPNNLTIHNKHETNHECMNWIASQIILVVIYWLITTHFAFLIVKTALVVIILVVIIIVIIVIKVIVIFSNSNNSNSSNRNIEFWFSKKVIKNQRNGKGSIKQSGKGQR